MRDYLLKYQPDIAGNVAYYEQLIEDALAYYREVLLPGAHRRKPRTTSWTRRSPRSATSLPGCAAARRPAGSPTRCRPWCSRSPRTGRSRTKDWFRALYRIFLGQSQGPRIGSFIALLGYATLHRAAGGAPGAGSERMSDGTTAADRGPRSSASEILDGSAKKGRLRRLLPFLGPAFIASIAYMDPGNFATNIPGGAQFGFMLLWVILASNLIAMLVQTLSAKLGIASGKNLAEHCREQFRKPVVFLMWILAEIVAMATDLAEFLGAALGFYLLLGIPLWIAGILTAVATFLILSLERFGFRPLEAVISGFVGIIAVSYLVETILDKPPLGQVLFHMVVPAAAGTGERPPCRRASSGPRSCPTPSTCTPPSRRAASSCGSPRKLRRLLRFEIADVIIAMGIAGLINMAMLVMAAATFFSKGITTDRDRWRRRTRPSSPSWARRRAGSSAFRSWPRGSPPPRSGTMAGQVIMQGFVQRRIPAWIRRLATMVPSLVVIAIGLDPTRTLVLSQVVLSFGLPFAIIPLVMFTRRKDIMGVLVNRPLTTVLAGLAAGAHRGPQPVPSLPDLLWRVMRCSSISLFPWTAPDMSESALPIAARLARTHPARPSPSCTSSRGTPPPRSTASATSSRPREAAAYLAEVVAACPCWPGLRVDTHVHEAEVRDVARSITEHTAELAPDLVVMSTHGTGGARRLLFGTIAQQVIAQGTTPVLLARPAREGSTTEPREWSVIVAPLDGNPSHEKGLPLAAELAAAFTLPPAPADGDAARGRAQRPGESGRRPAPGGHAAEAGNGQRRGARLPGSARRGDRGAGCAGHLRGVARGPGARHRSHGPEALRGPGGDGHAREGGDGRLLRRERGRAASPPGSASRCCSCLFGTELRE